MTTESSLMALAEIMEQHLEYRMTEGYRVAKTPFGWVTYLDGIELGFVCGLEHFPIYHPTVLGAIDAAWYHATQLSLMKRRPSNE